MDSVLSRLKRRIEETRWFASTQSKRRFLVHVAVAVVVLGGLTLLLQRHLSFLTDVGQLRSFVDGFGIWAPVVLIVLQAAQVVLAPIPGQVLAVVAGYLFGVWWGTLYNMIGITIGSTIAFSLSRRYGRPYVEGIVHEDTLDRFDAIADEDAALALFVMFLLPGLPDDMLCFAGGLTSIPLWRLVLIAVVARTPAFLLVNVVGDFLGSGQYVAAILLSVALTATAVLGYRHRDRLVRFFGGTSAAEA